MLEWCNIEAHYAEPKSRVFVNNNSDREKCVPTSLLSYIVDKGWEVYLKVWRMQKNVEESTKLACGILIELFMLHSCTLNWYKKPNAIWAVQRSHLGWQRWKLKYTQMISPKLHSIASFPTLPLLNSCTQAHCSMAAKNSISVGEKAMCSKEATHLHLDPCCSGVKMPNTLVALCKERMPLCIFWQLGKHFLIEFKTSDTLI